MEKDNRFKTSEDRRKNYIDLIAVLDDIFSMKSRDEWIERFQGYNFVYSPIYDYGEMVEDPQFAESEMIVEMDHHSMGKIRTVGFPVQFSKTPASIQCAAPEYGANTEEVMVDFLGNAWDEVEKLRKAGAFGV
jgi:crotonobetainyl-CoA:carnitine CoA-transferase CaiB-like acyl-CoA transferase